MTRVTNFFTHAQYKWCSMGGCRWRNTQLKVCSSGICNQWTQSLLVNVYVCRDTAAWRPSGCLCSRRNITPHSHTQVPGTPAILDLWWPHPEVQHFSYPATRKLQTTLTSLATHGGRVHMILSCTLVAIAYTFAISPANISCCNR